MVLLIYAVVLLLFVFVEIVFVTANSEVSMKASGCVAVMGVNQVLYSI